MQQISNWILLFSLVLTQGAFAQTACRRVLQDSEVSSENEFVQFLVERGKFQQAAWAARRSGETELARGLEKRLAMALKNEEVRSLRLMKRPGVATEVYTVEFTSGMKAIFKPRPEHWEHVDGWAESASNADAEVLVYQLNAELGLSLVPVTIETKLDAKLGSLQAFCESDGSKPMKEELELLRIFDYLIRNHDRREDNYLTNKGHLIAIDHGRTFIPERIHDNSELVYSLEELKFDRSRNQRKFFDALQALSETKIRQMMGKSFETVKIEEFLQRRQQLLRKWRGLFQ
jgi:hypothetical protein